MYPTCGQCLSDSSLSLSLCPLWLLAVCLDLQCAPEGDWHCPYCRDKFGPGRKCTGESSNMGGPIIIRLTRVVKAPESETGGCVVCRLVTNSL